MQVFNMAILVHPNTPSSTLFGPQEIFTLASSLINDVTLKIALISETKGRQTMPGGSSIEVNAQFGDKTVYDLVIIPGLGIPSSKRFTFPPKAISWLQQMSALGVPIASICTGAFLFAETGLLNDRIATTHWLMADQFRVNFPKVKLDIDLMVSRDGDFWCSGGAFAYQDLCLALIRHHWGKRVAQQCANILLLEPTRESQSSFMALKPHKMHADAIIAGIQTYIDKHFHKAMSNHSLAQNFHIGERQLLRRFKAATGSTPNLYLQKIRINAAQQALKDSNDSIAVIANQVGFDDPAYFRTLFKRHVGQTPTQYRKRYQTRQP